MFAFFVILLSIKMNKNGSFYKLLLLESLAKTTTQDRSTLIEYIVKIDGIGL